jgi:hypothetical protein
MTDRVSWDAELTLDEIDRIQITPGNDDQIRKPFCPI